MEKPPLAPTKSAGDIEAWQQLRSKFISLDQAHIDTDQIIPARFLKQTHKEGLAQALFHDWRYDENGRKRSEHPLNQLENAGLRILVAGPNFACGSSREHAVWALYAYGFRAVLSPSFSDIFTSNALKNGLLPLEIPNDFYAHLLRHPEHELAIDLQRYSLQIIGGPALTFKLEAFARNCLMQGLDQLGYLLQHETAISLYEQEHA